LLAASLDDAIIFGCVVQEMADSSRIDLTDEAVIILKHHGSYMQQNRDLQRTDKAAYAQSFQFMLRLKVPCGKLPADVYRVVDDLSEKYGQQDLRATTRQAWQVSLEAILFSLGWASLHLIAGSRDPRGKPRFCTQNCCTSQTKRLFL
jgi:sulfite reductase beta subunit-like hemoprotein